MESVPAPAELAITPVGHDEHTWLAETDGMSSRAQMRAGSGTYRSTIPAPIAGWRPLVPADLSADLDEATASLVRLDWHAASTLGENPGVLGPMSSVLLRTESASSSQIENITVGARQLALAGIGESRSPNARLVAGNVRQMEAALALADRLDVDSLLAMHAALLGSERHNAHDDAGTFRDQLVWVGSSSISPRGADHVAPQAELVPAAVADLMAFVARADLPGLLQCAVAHAQLETIHPFTDGNGRTGRALVAAMLRALRVTVLTTAPLSAGLLTNTSRYIDALTAFRAGDAAPIARQFARAARFAASTGARLIDDIAAQLDDARERLGGLRPQAAGWRLLPHLVAQPVVTSRFVEDALGVPNASAQRAIAQLAAAGVLTEETGGRRNRVWSHRGILDVLDAYAESARRG
ncbi:Fic family protein [Georgenia sp. Z1491]|uniref:Fic family protein n=1 Tax=Georgenia sp. Z1491 TaxID=3416707 RepID=UPI003CF4DD48